MDPINKSTSVTKIAEIQGTGDTSPYVGQTISTEGTVSWLTHSGSGFFIEDESGGIRVFTKNAPSVAVGDRVLVTGRVDEFVNLKEETAANIRPETQLKATRPDDVIRIGTGELAEPSELPTLPVNNLPETLKIFEFVEGQRFKLKNALVIGASAYGDVTVLANMGEGTPGLNNGILNEGSTSLSHRIPLRVPRELWSMMAPGVVFSDLTAVMGMRNGSYQAEVTAHAEPTLFDRQPTLIAPLTAEQEKRTLRVLSYNLENSDPQREREHLVQTHKDIDDDIGDGKTKRQGEHIAKIRPDIVVLPEVQDGDGAEQTTLADGTLSLQALLNSINGANGPEYKFIDFAPVDDAEGGQPGGNIRTAILYRPDRVTLNGGSNKRLFENSPEFDGSRKPTSATFHFKGEGVERDLTVVGVHNSSQRGGDAEHGYTQPPRPGKSEQRQAQAKDIVDLVSTATNDTIAIGDWNSGADTLPFHEGTGELYEESLPTEERWTHIFGGIAHMLDHAYGNIREATVKMQMVRVNAAFAPATRTGDHDPAVVDIAY